MYRYMPRIATPKINPGRIFEARQQASMTQEQVARKMRCSVVTVGKYERGERNPSPGALIRMAKALDKEPEFFYAEQVAA